MVRCREEDSNSGLVACLPQLSLDEAEHRKVVNQIAYCAFPVVIQCKLKCPHVSSSLSCSVSGHAHAADPLASAFEELQAFSARIIAPKDP